jgi:hypothetical protein
LKHTDTRQEGDRKETEMAIEGGRRRCRVYWKGEREREIEDILEGRERE